MLALINMAALITVQYISTSHSAIFQWQSQCNMSVLVTQCKGHIDPPPFILCYLLHLRHTHIF